MTRKKVAKKKVKELTVDQKIKHIERTMANVETVLNKLNEEDEFKMAIKARDDLIEALKKKVEILTKSKEVDEEIKLPEQYKKDYDELRKSIDDINYDLVKTIKKLSTLFKEDSSSEVEELEMAIKARDDLIEALRRELLKKSYY